jgi:hypothetical protein
MNPPPADKALSGVGKTLGEAFVGAMVDKVIERSAAALVGAAL